MALKLLAQGFSLIPIRTDGTKAPALEAWKEFQSRRATIREIKEWFGEGSFHGLAVVCGEVNGNLEVLDFDDPSALITWKKLLRSEPRGTNVLRKLDLRIQTPRGGCHLPYRCPDGIGGSQKLAVCKVEGEDRVKTLIETRGEGAYFVHHASPAACHELNKQYRLLKGSYDDIPILSAQERELALRCARLLNEWVPPENINTGQGTNQDGNRPGDQFNKDATWGEVLEPKDWIQVRTEAGSTFWRRPGKDQGWSATTGHASRDILYNFSSNTFPFEADRGYSKFSAYALLYFEGDFKAAAKHLSGTTGNGSADKQTQAQILVDRAKDVELFSNPDHVGFATFVVDDHPETWPIRSKGFKRWLVREFYQQEAKPPGSQALQDALGLLEARAQFDGPTLDVFTRVAGLNSKLYIDLADADWRVVEVARNGWEILDESPVKFRRTAGMLPLPVPQPGGTINDLKPLVNYGEESNWILAVSWLLTAFNPDGPFPVLILQGEHGAAKSTQQLLLRSLVDPASAPLRTVPRNERDLMIAARNSWILAFDNLSNLRDWLSDALCRLATGGGFSTRRLYSNSDEEIFSAQRPILLNGIKTFATRSDLVDRALLVHLPQIQKEGRRGKKELMSAFEEVAPTVLGALLDAAVTGLRRSDEVTLDSLPRMADFARWVVACEPALPWKPGHFMLTYEANRRDAIESTLEADPLAAAVRSFIEPLDSWAGTPSELHRRLEAIVDERTLNAKAWLGSPSWLTQRLKERATFLSSIGIDITLPTRGQDRTIAIRKLEEDAVIGVDRGTS